MPADAAIICCYTLAITQNGRANSMAAYRHEYKHEINKSDFITLSMRLNAALKADEFARADGAYEITSLYHRRRNREKLRHTRQGQHVPFKR